MALIEINLNSSEYSKSKKLSIEKEYSTHLSEHTLIFLYGKETSLGYSRPSCDSIRVLECDKDDMEKLNRTFVYFFDKKSSNRERSEDFNRVFKSLNDYYKSIDSLQPVILISMSSNKTEVVKFSKLIC
jgi:hypothetical protein